MKAFTHRNLPPKNSDLDAINAGRSGTASDGWGWLPFALVVALLLVGALYGFGR